MEEAHRLTKVYDLVEEKAQKMKEFMGTNFRKIKYQIAVVSILASLNEQAIVCCQGPASGKTYEAIMLGLYQAGVVGKDVALVVPTDVLKK